MSDELEIKNFRDGALDAGIPLSVIEGRTKLKEHFSQEYIDAQCGRKNDNDEAVE